MTTAEIDIPLYGAAFLDDERLVVAGGGGLGNHGLKNQLVAINIKDNSRVEYDFPKGSDCPMSLAARNGQLVVGANSNGAVNNHFNLFDGNLKLTLQQSFFDQSFYQRNTALGQDRLAILGTSEQGTSFVHVIESSTLKKLWSLEFKDDVRDLSFSENGELFAIVLPKKVVFHEPQTGRVVHTLDAAADTKFSRGKFTSDTKFVIAGGSSKQTQVMAYKIEEKPMLVSIQKIPIKSVTSLAVSGALIAIGSASGDVVVVTDKLSLLATVKSAHRLPVSGVAISASGVVASVSVAGSVHIIKPPFSSKAWMGAVTTVGWVSLALAVLALLVAVIFSGLQTDALTLWKWDGRSATPSGPAAVASMASQPQEVVHEETMESPETVYETVYAEPTTVYETIEPTTIYEFIPEPSEDVKEVFEGEVDPEAAQ